MSSQRIMSLPIPTSSEALGMPRRPSSVETKPSFITPPAESPMSSACVITGIPKGLTYSIAFRISPESVTGIPSSEIATHPASHISPMSASSPPLSPLVIAPIGNTLTIPSVLAFKSMYSVTEALSFMGFVLGIHTMEVKPPAAAARQPVFIVSLCS